MASNTNTVPRNAVEQRASIEQRLAEDYRGRSQAHVAEAETARTRGSEIDHWYHRMEAMHQAFISDLHLYAAEMCLLILSADPYAVQTYNPEAVIRNHAHGTGPKMEDAQIDSLSADGAQEPVPGWDGAGASVEAQRG